MGMIINTKLPKFKLGYPTVSDKYNVDSGVLAGTAKEGLPYGTILMFGENAGEYVAFDGADVATIAGPMTAVNVKIADPYTGEVKVMPGQACSRLLDGYIALVIDSDTNVTSVKPGKAVSFAVADGKVVLGVGKTTTIPGWYFTGLTDEADGNLLAEIEIVRK